MKFLFEFDEFFFLESKYNLTTFNFSYHRITNQKLKANFYFILELNLIHLNFILFFKAISDL